MWWIYGEDQDVEDMSDEELRKEEIRCQKWIEFWAVDLQSPDSDYVADAARGIRATKKRLNKVLEEKKRRHERG